MYIFCVILIIIGFIVFIQPNKSIIYKMIGIEVIVLGCSVILLYSSYILDDIIGNIYTLYIIGVVTGESAIGLCLIICYYNHYYVLYNKYI